MQTNVRHFDWFLLNQQSRPLQSKGSIKRADRRIHPNGIEEYLSLSKIAEHYFGKSCSWLYQRINGLTVNPHNSPKKNVKYLLKPFNKSVKKTITQLSELLDLVALFKTSSIRSPRKSFWKGFFIFSCKNSPYLC